MPTLATGLCKAWLSQQQQRKEAAAGDALQSFQIGWMAVCQGAR